MLKPNSKKKYLKADRQKWKHVERKKNKNDSRILIAAIQAKHNKATSLKCRKTSINNVNRIVDKNEEKISKLENRAKKMPQNVIDLFIQWLFDC